VATDSTEGEVEQRMREAIEFQVAGLKQQGEPVPEPHSSSSHVEVSV